MCLISVIIPIYNVEQYLAKCIESVCRQSYENLEIILVNDGSTDGSETICLEYANNDERIRYCKKENGGLSDARNFGIDCANGDYLSFVDSDDYIEPTFIEYLYKAIEKEKTVVSMTSFDRVDSAGIFLKAEILPTDQSVLSGRDACKKMLEEHGNRFVVVWNKLYKKELFDCHRFENGKLHEDEYFTYRLLYDLEKVAIVHDCLYHYVNRENSITTSNMTEHRFRCLIEFQNERMCFYKNIGDGEVLLECYYSFLRFAIEFSDKYKQWMTVKQKKFLQKQYRKVFIDMMNSNQVSLVKKLYYSVGYINLPLIVIVKLVLHQLSFPKSY
ncbi:TPA: glycosyltransferase [Streptococcus suis]|nr:glycosyltransferase [Streptococcus suis]HEM6106713.1 glycosyltransferase [Streptococcus suis]HEM6108867.1 glycosyltransferase [Streptococcus suis]HEM6115201.1 glycosyltransferase [Streptococcus suis]